MKPRFLSRSLVPALVLLSAVAAFPSCGGESDDDPAGTGGQSGQSGSAGASGSTGGDATGGSSTGGTGGTGGSGGAMLDAGDLTDVTPPEGCGQIDFLFIVDNSASMQDNQAQLVAAFPGFITAIENQVHAGSNYHIMVADTDAWGRCNTANPWTGSDPTSNLCNAYVKQTVFEECDRTWGAGVVHPAGQYASNQVCSFPSGRRYVQQDDPDITGTFACAAQVGVAGHPSERPMDALLAALDPSINGPGGCNEDFLRDDALLVITFISDDPKYEDSGTPPEWYDAVVQAKHGDPEAVVVVGLTPAFDECGGSGIKGAHWAEFVAMFPFSLHASVCSADYASVFTEAVKVIDDSCDQFKPPA